MAFHLHVSFIWFSYIDSISKIPERNILSEIIYIFFIMRNDIKKTSFCTSEPAEHGIGMIRQRTREFTIIQMMIENGVIDR